MHSPLLEDTSNIIFINLYLNKINITGDMDIRIANKYRLGRKIGGGSFGDIYLGMFLTEKSFP